MNRHEIESTIGVDLIVYFEAFRSYLLVQYKRLHARDGSGSEPCYWPDSDRNFDRELRRMMGLIPGATRNTPDSPIDYRLSNDPFFFKFCRADVFDPDEVGMVHGLYLPVHDVDHFLRSPHCRGERGGRRVSYDAVGRRFSNTLFVSVAREGWIGSSNIGSQFIERYVEDAMSDGRSVTLAGIEHTGR